MPVNNYSLLSLFYSVDLTLNNTDPSNHLFEDFIMLFISDQDVGLESYKIKIQSVQQNTEAFRQKLTAFIEYYKEHDLRFHRLLSYFQKLKENEHFILWPTDDLSPEKRNELHLILTSLEESLDYKVISREHNELFASLLEAYHLMAFGELTKEGIGEKNKEMRVCRFCGKKRPTVSFKNVAHAISESLGNKKIILHEECDECNERFGSASGIEKSLISYLKIYGSYFGVKGKSGVAKFKGRNFTLTNEGIIKLDHFLRKGEKPHDTSFRLETYEKIVAQDIYRTLCKYALSVIDSSVLINLRDTVRWINREYNLDRLPKVGLLKSYERFTKHPSILIYQRKNMDTTLPFLVGELHYTFLIIVYIIPLAAGDVNFTDEISYGRFWQFFKHYSRSEGWQFLNLSDQKEKDLTINLNFDIKGENIKSD
ncbi:HNH endonuclease [Chitinophaga sp. CF418]|uniref:HNH endonuclease n=1 Tax=Chitinophaga sp. CF418 TaxID=1855287 RepID=UPI00091569E7|nr:HNH endonuclease [Chitinophaga sp. CF418]SHN24963.1 hypothetical protein SAMN05216311_107296 [Chitinophaga sp. CF418]